MQLNDIRAASRQSGFSLIELMIALTISLIVLAALISLYVNSSRARDELERADRLTENGRYALQQLIIDLQLAGFYGGFDHALAAATLDYPADLPNPCSTSLAELDLQLPFPIQGLDDAGSGALDCVPDARPGSDVVVVRRLSTCFGGQPECPMVAGAPYFQASRCRNDDELLSPDSDDWFVLHTNIAALTKTRRDCLSRAPIRRFRTHIYFIANNGRAGDGVPTLKRAELLDGRFVVASVASGIENLQLEYGIDTNGDGAADAYTADPARFQACNAPACRMLNWRNAVSVRLSLLARSQTRGGETGAAKTFQLGRDFSGTPVVLGPYSDRYRRRVFHATVTLRNVAGRRR